jgi:hypothetical protein
VDPGGQQQMSLSGIRALFVYLQTCVQLPTSTLNYPQTYFLSLKFQVFTNSRPGLSVTRELGGKPLGYTFTAGPARPDSHPCDKGFLDPYHISLSRINVSLEFLRPTCRKSSIQFVIHVGARTQTTLRLTRERKKNK